MEHHKKRILLDYLSSTKIYRWNRHHMLFRLPRSTCFIVAVLAGGCSAATSDATYAHLDSQSDTPVFETQGQAQSTAAAPAAATSATDPADACTTEAAWNANSDLTFDGDDGMSKLAAALNPLVHASDESPLAITSHLEPHCVWKAVFSADDGVTSLADNRHAATSTAVLRNPQGLWTAAPQSTGWMHVTDAASRRIWIPLAEVTASAKYDTASCATLTARATATLPESASSIALTTAQGPTTLGALLGKKTSSSPSGWKVRLTFSAALAQ
jgi:hypothetical protein